MPTLSPATMTAATTTTAHKSVSTDIIGDIIGDFGIWQLRTILIIFLCKIPAAWFMACIIFTAPELYPSTEFQCDMNTLYDNDANCTVTEDQCYIMEYTTNNSEVYEKSKCTNFIYDFDFKSLIMQFDLVCTRDIFVAWTQYWHLFGVLVGGVMATKMMLWISPLNVYFIGMLAQIICGVVTGYARDFSLHCAFRCLSAVCCAIMFTSGQAIFVDITAGRHRIAAIILYDTFWSIGVILLPTLSSFFNSWTHIYLGITFPTILLMLLLNWTPESPRWLLKHANNKDDIDRVEAIIRAAAAINDRSFKIPDDFHLQLQLLSEKLKAQTTSATWPQLWHGKRAKIHMIAAHIALAAFIINFMGMLLNIRSFGRNYLVPNSIAMGFSEIVGCFLALHFMLKQNKKKWQWAGGLNIIAGCIGCLGWTFTDITTMNATVKVILWMIIAMIPKAGVSCAQSMLLACMNELVPASKKQLFVFSVVTWARIWLLSAPFLNVLKKINVALSLTSYCVLSIIGGICMCLLITPNAIGLAPATVPVSTAAAGVVHTKKDEAVFNTAIWTVDGDANSTRL